MKEQFLPNNTSWIAKEDLKKLRQDRSVREYVKKYSSLILDIDNISEEDKLFNFLLGLQPWAQMELQRQRVLDLSSAIAGAEGLVDLRPNDSDENAGNSENSSKEWTKKKNKKKFGGEEPKQATGDGKSERKANGKGSKSNL